MPEPIRPSKLEEVMKDVVNVPEPDAEFMNSLRTRFIAEGHASAKKNQETQMKQKVFSRRLTWALVILVLVSLVALFTQPTVVNALKRLFGYVPNVGIIDQTSEVRTLAQSITVTRENYTVTIEQAVLNSEKTAIVYSYSLPPDYVASDGNSSLTLAPFITMPDGNILNIMMARHVASADCPQCFIRYLMEFPPIPADVNEVILDIPDLVAVPSDTAPKDWQIQLKFKPADPSEIAPVIEQEITPMPTTASMNVPTQSDNPYGITNKLDKFVSVPDGYILYGSTSWTDINIPPYGVESRLLNIKDAMGTEIPFDFADVGNYPEPGKLTEYWAYKIGGKFTSPLTLSFGMIASLPADGGSFTFDPGHDPQLGRKWNLNQDTTVNNEVIHILSAEQGGIEPGFFLFEMQTDANIIGASIVDLAHPPQGGGGGGGGGLPEIGDPFYAGFGYQMPLPQGPLTLTFTNVEVIVPGDWTLIWNP